MTDIETYWKSGQPLYRCMDRDEYKLWLKNNQVPANISFSNDLKFAESFNPWDKWGESKTWLMILEITLNGKHFEESYKRVLLENDKLGIDFFLDLPYEVMFDISFKLDNVTHKVIK